MKFRELILPLIIIFNAYVCFGQQDGFWNTEMERIAKPTSKWGWIDFKEGVSLDPNTIFIEYAEAFGLNNDDVMVLLSTKQDEAGYTHYTYQQYHKGIRVNNAVYKVHVNPSGQVYSANGKLMPGQQPATQASIDEKEAIEIALNFIDADEYMWESEYWENRLKEKSGNPNATYYPKPELVYSRSRNSRPWNGEEFKLSFILDIATSSPHDENRLLIDAVTGEVLNVIPLYSHCDPASVVTVFDGTRNFNADEYLLSGTDFRLDDDCQDAEWYVRDWNSLTATANPQDITSVDNTWTTQDQRFGATVSWMIGLCYNYFLNTHTWISYDSLNGDVDAYINAVFATSSGGVTWNNASMSFTGGTMKVGLSNSGNLNNCYATVDIIGHEYKHAVTGISSELVYQDESGALNESFSDIFGEMIERNTFGVNDWLIGSQRVTGAIRSMSNPSDTLYNDPDTYLGTNWASTGPGAFDFGGVHTNSGVMNYWFYLLSVGGSGTNDNGDDYSVTGIGTTAARAIAFRANVVYLTASDQYIDAREATIRAATDIFGSCSMEAIQVGNAWYAVGVGRGMPEYNLQVCGPVNSGLPGETVWRQGVNSVIGGSFCATTVTSSISHIRFVAANSIELKDGFTATATGFHDFTAFINDCSFTVWKGQQLVDNDNQQDHWQYSSNQIEEKRIGNMEIQPNPFKDRTSVVYYTRIDEILTINVYDASGKLIISKPYNAAIGRNEVEIDLMKGAPGIYVVNIRGEQSSNSMKVVKM